MKQGEEISRGDQAKHVLNNAIFIEAMMILRGQAMEAFQKTKFDQNEERNEIWRQLNTIDWLERQLKSVMETGKLAEATPKPNQD